MADVRPVKPALLVVAAFSRHADALAWGQEQLQERYGPVALSSEPFAFNHTEYYQPTMGTELRKQLLVFRDLVDPAVLAAIKLRTNVLEDDLAKQQRYPEERPLNLDPGLLTLGKFMLATTKDQAHRIYLRDGIFAEVTLRYHAGVYEAWPWTYADYREPGVHEFLLRAREYYRERLQSMGK